MNGLHKFLQVWILCNDCNDTTKFQYSNWVYVFLLLELSILTLCLHCSLEVDDNNVIMLPGKKNNKKKGTKKVSGKPKTNKNTEMSKSQKRKLKKLQDDKEKELLFSKSIETLEKFKIGEDAYSLMWSSRNLGQVFVTAKILCLKIDN